MSGWSVLLSRPEDLRPADIAKMLAKHRRVPVLDVLPSVRRSGGILSEGLDEAAACAEAEALTAGGFPAMALEGGEVAVLPEALEIPKLALEAGGLSWSGGSRPWEMVSLIAAAAFTETTSRIVKSEEGPSAGEKAARIGLTLATGLPLGMGKSKEVEKRVETSDLLFVADLILVEPFARVRVNAQRFDYSVLEGKMGFGTLQNFKSLLAALRARAPKARLNRGCLVLLENKPVREMGYESIDGLEREIRWRVTLGL